MKAAALTLLVMLAGCSSGGSATPMHDGGSVFTTRGDAAADGGAEAQPDIPISMYGDYFVRAGDIGQKLSWTTPNGCTYEFAFMFDGAQLHLGSTGLLFRPSRRTVLVPEDARFEVDAQTINGVESPCERQYLHEVHIVASLALHAEGAVAVAEGDGELRHLYDGSKTVHETATVHLRLEIDGEHLRPAPYYGGDVARATLSMTTDATTPSDTGKVEARIDRLGN